MSYSNNYTSSDNDDEGLTPEQKEIDKQEKAQLQQAIMLSLGIDNSSDGQPTLPPPSFANTLQKPLTLASFGSDSNISSSPQKSLKYYMDFPVQGSQSNIESEPTLMSEIANQKKKLIQLEEIAKMETELAAMKAMEQAEQEQKNYQLEKELALMKAMEEAEKQKMHEAIHLQNALQEQEEKQKQIEKQKILKQQTLLQKNMLLQQKSLLEEQYSKHQELTSKMSMMTALIDKAKNQKAIEQNNQEMQMKKKFALLLAEEEAAAKAAMLAKMKATKMDELAQLKEAELAAELAAKAKLEAEAAKMNLDLGYNLDQGNHIQKKFFVKRVRRSRSRSPPPSDPRTNLENQIHDLESKIQVVESQFSDPNADQDELQNLFEQYEDEKAELAAQLANLVKN